MLDGNNPAAPRPRTAFSPSASGVSPPMQASQVADTRAGAEFVGGLASFNEFGQTTAIERHYGTRYFVNEFWTARQRQANRIHELSYRACFKPQLPAFFIKRLTQSKDIVYDPFMGRGTTPVEAALQGRIPFGNDANPLSKAMVEPRINPPDISAVEQRLKEIPWRRFRDPEHEELLVFYHPETLRQIEGLRAWLLEREAAATLDRVDAWIRMVALNRLTGHSPGFFSVYTLPPNQAVTVERQRRINARRQQFPPLRDVPALVAKKSRALLSQSKPEAARGMFLTERSDNTPQIPDASVALTVTSPPFLDIVDYETDNWLRCWFIGVDPKAVSITQCRSIDDWRRFVSATLAELTRITRPGGHIAFEVGEVRKATLRLEEQVIDAARGLPLTLLGVMVNQQQFTKTSNCWGVANNSRGTNSNRIVLFAKAE